MPGLRDILEAATPGPWHVDYGWDEGPSDGPSPHGWVAPHGAYSDNRATNQLIALAPELAALVLAQNKEIQEKAKQHHRSWGHEKSFAKCIWPICESARDFAARLDRLGKEEL